jgi:hypothetical protein
MGLRGGEERTGRENNLFKKIQIGKRKEKVRKNKFKKKRK